ncbi:MAG TPA: hypothetical protein VFW27_20400, partial [Actinoplanes sp.]|nr:hypothetical protein [Actinoplanes sp.]
GDLPLRWHVTAGAAEGGGSVSYRVLSRGTPAPADFAIELDPAQVKAGERVTVTHRAYDEGVTITGCSAAYSPGGAPAACHDTGQGWAADVEVPGDAPAGIGRLLWHVSYDRVAPSTADGEVGMPVLAPRVEERSWPAKLWDYLRKGGIALAGFAALIAWRLAGPAIRRRWKQFRDERVEPLPDHSIRLVRPRGAPRVALAEPDGPPVPVLRLTLRRGVPRIRVHQEFR